MNLTINSTSNNELLQKLAKAFVFVLGGSFIAGVVFYLVLVIAYAVPESLVSNHLHESSEILIAEGDHPIDLVTGKTYDNSTTSIMLSQCVGGGSPYFCSKQCLLLS